jgi:hypothetical protein
MRKSICSKLCVMLGAVGVFAVVAAAPAWSAESHDRSAAKAHHYRHHVRQAVRNVDPPADAVEFGAAARVSPMRPHTGGTK